MMTSDFRPEVEISPFNACAMSSMQYNHYLSLSDVLWNLGKPSKIRPTVSSRQNIPAV